jgi:glycosyltransferase involved in cell wall biosynthesis
LTYPFSAGLVLQTNAAIQWARRRAPFGQLCVIPNAVTRFDEIEQAVKKEELVLGVGRLSHEKRFDRLIRSFAAIALDYPLARLRIVGDGPLRKQLRSLADSTGFGPRIELPGAVLNISAEFNRAKLFALTSDFEGFPNALLEAMSLGLPVISLDCPSGPAEIVTSGINGILVPRDNENDLVLALRRILDDPKLAMRLGVKAKEVTQTYASESILGKWETFLWSVVSGRRE